jgi:hypothetical protein
VGVIRKTLSISTLGIVDFRSKKELLRRAEKAQAAARAELIGEQAARAAADERVAAAERRARQAEALARQQVKKTEATKRRGRRKASVLETLESAASPLEARAKDLGRRGRKAAEKAAKHAEAAAEKARKQARKQAKRTKQKLDEVTDAATDFVKDRR